MAAARTLGRRRGTTPRFVPCSRHQSSITPIAKTLPCVRNSAAPTLLRPEATQDWDRLMKL